MSLFEVSFVSAAYWTSAMEMRWVWKIDFGEGGE